MLNANRTQIQIDVAVLAAETPDRPRRVLSLGEVKWGRAMGMNDLNRLIRARDLLAQQGLDASGATLACYSGVGFDDDLRAVPGVLLVDPVRLYA
jgi:uncharacterized protein